jgi:hypothetical protein
VSEGSEIFTEACRKESDAFAQWVELAIATVAARLLARPIMQEYDAFTVVELGVNPASDQPVEVADARLLLVRSSSQRPVHS